MKALVLSDIHGEIEELRSILNRETGYDLIVVAGDITDTSVDDYRGRAEEIVDLLDEQGRFVKAVPGNMDDEDILEVLVRNRVNLHKDLFTLGEYDFVGFGGGRTPPGVETPFEPEDEERGEILGQLLDRTKSERTAVVSHEPPKNTSADRTSSGDHVGSEELRSLIEDGDIDLVISGHIHEAVGRDEVGGTVVVNPGPVKQGKYAVVEMEDGIDIEFRG
ncbi:MAG: metallophosphoesterase [Candidatus Nanohaloarchaea archaeon]|nr:metallophosphoesterase [Candidatus Nanohaloarchaea archaeon]